LLPKSNFCKHLVNLSLALVLYSVVPQSMSQTIEAKLTKDLMIGFREDSTEYLFSRISRVCTDAEENIFIGDGRSQQITKFNKDGYFIEHIGRRGQGPGEIMELTDMTLNQNGDLVVLDRRNRRVSIFFKNSVQVKGFPFTGKGCVDPYIVRQMSSGRYFLYYCINNYESTSAVFHFFDDECKQIVEEFDDKGIIWDRNNLFDCDNIGSYKDRIQFINDNVFYFTPWLYHGQIYKFEKLNTTWDVEVIKGYNPKLKSHVPLNYSDYATMNWSTGKVTNKKDTPVNSYSSSGPMGSFFAQVIRRARGIYILNNGIMVHFSEKHKKGNVYIQMIEFFSKEGEFLGCHVYDEKDLSRNDNELLLKAVLCKDSEDRFYFEAIYEGVPVMIRMNLNYTLGE